MLEAHDVKNTVTIPTLIRMSVIVSSWVVASIEMMVILSRIHTELAMYLAVAVESMKKFGPQRPLWKLCWEIVLAYGGE